MHFRRLNPLQPSVVPTVDATSTHTTTRTHTHTHTRARVDTIRGLIKTQGLLVWPHLALHATCSHAVGPPWRHPVASPWSYARPRRHSVPRRHPRLHEARVSWCGEVTSLGSQPPPPPVMPDYAIVCEGNVKNIDVRVWRVPRTLVLVCGPYVAHVWPMCGPCVAHVCTNDSL